MSEKYPSYAEMSETLAKREVPGVIAKQKPEQSDSARRKAQPLFQGCLMYFPDALLAVAEHSRKANEKHNPGEPIHWSKDKSKDHADCIARHLLDIGPKWDATDPEFGSLHATALAWRALALLQTVLERERTTAVAANPGGLRWGYWDKDGVFVPDEAPAISEGGAEA